jgi:hypothetical protein
MIAYDNSIPDEQQLNRLAHPALKEEALTFSNVCKSRFVVVAYDHDLLVGIGTISQHNQLQAEWNVRIHESYKEREVETNIRKLLKAQYQLTG